MAQTMTIEVLDGVNRFRVLQDGQPSGVLQLTGRLLPFRPIKYAGKQRVKTTFYPGNPEATQQIMGPTLEPSTFTGMWRDRYLGDGTAESLVAIFTDIASRGASVRVTWGGTIAGGGGGFLVAGQPFVRVGMISAHEFSPSESVGDVGWSMTFDWRSNGTLAAPSVAATGLVSQQDDLQAVVADLQLASAAWQAAQEGPLLRTTGIPQRLADGMEQAMSAIDAAAATISDVSSRATVAALAPAIAAGQLIGAVTGAIDQLAVTTNLLLGMNVLASEVRDDAVSALRLTLQNFTLLEFFDTAAERCADARTGARARMEPEVIAEVRAPAGTDLRDLALRFYGDADAWGLIAEFNNLDGSAVPSPPAGPSDNMNGLPLLIPRLSSSTIGNVREQC